MKKLLIVIFAKILTDLALLAFFGYAGTSGYGSGFYNGYTIAGRLIFKAFEKLHIINSTGAILTIPMHETYILGFIMGSIGGVILAELIRGTREHEVHSGCLGYYSPFYRSPYDKVAIKK